MKVGNIFKEMILNIQCVKTGEMYKKLYLKENSKLKYIFWKIKSAEDP